MVINLIKSRGLPTLHGCRIRVGLGIQQIIQARP